jgi:SAM-dependent methyltransferase
MDLSGFRVLDVGARNVNGSLRGEIEPRCREYIGTDILPGPGVDRICPAAELPEAFGPGQFDLVICTEVMEHILDWRRAVAGIKTVLRDGGTLLFTVPSRGFGYHEYPFDFWRFEVEDLREIFSDFDLLTIRKNTEYPGVFLLARKPAGRPAADLGRINLYSILRQRRCDLDEGSKMTRFMKMKARLLEHRRSLRRFVPAGIRSRLYDILYR